MTKSELHAQIDSMTDEEAAQVKLIFAPEWPSKATSIDMDELRRDGAPRQWLRRREEEDHDGTRLRGCVKFYIPQPVGRWGRYSLAMKRLRSPRCC